MVRERLLKSLPGICLWSSSRRNPSTRTGTAIARVQAKAKLSQNRTPAQAAHAAARLEAMEDPLTRETGRRMRAAVEASS